LVQSGLSNRSRAHAWISNPIKHWWIKHLLVSLTFALHRQQVTIIRLTVSYLRIQNLSPMWDELRCILRMTVMSQVPIQESFVMFLYYLLRIRVCFPFVLNVVVFNVFLFRLIFKSLHILWSIIFWRILRRYSPTCKSFLMFTKDFFSILRANVQYCTKYISEIISFSEHLIIIIITVLIPTNSLILLFVCVLRAILISS